MSKRVRFTLEVDNSFVNLLRAALTLRLGKIDDPQRKVSVLEVLGIAALGEAMGAHSEETWARIPPEWRPHIDVIPDGRRVLETSN